MKRKSVRVLLVIAIFAFVLWMVPTYRVGASGAGELLCHEAQCYLFINEQYAGWVGNYLSDFGSILAALLGGTNRVSDFSYQLVVIRITPTSIDRYSFPHQTFLLGVFSDQIYFYRGRDRWKWAHTHFEPVLLDEQQRFEEAYRRGEVLTGMFSNKKGWSSALILNPGRHQTLPLGREQIVLGKYGEPLEKESIVLERPGAPPETIWSLDGSPKWADRIKYRQIFGPSH